MTKNVNDYIQMAKGILTVSKFAKHFRLLFFQKCKRLHENDERNFGGNPSEKFLFIIFLKNVNDYTKKCGILKLNLTFFDLKNNAENNTTTIKMY